jgi:hypothetical protein
MKKKGFSLRKRLFFKSVLKRIKHNKFILEKEKMCSINAMDDSFRKIYYVRYTDDSIIVFIGLM